MPPPPPPSLLRLLLWGGLLLAHASGTLRQLPPPWRPHAVFVNLDRRPDRRAAVERELARAGWPPSRVHRLNATLAAGDGLFGCNDSHRRALAQAAAQLAAGGAWGHVLVLEDDVAWRDARAAAAQLAAFHAWDQAAAADATAAGGRRWDVALLAGLRREIVAEAPVDGARGPPPATLSLRRAVNYQSTAAYLVHAEYLPRLLRCAEAATAAMAAEGAARHAWNSLDQAWKPLQAAGAWVHFEPMLLDQAPGVSDITGLHADYASAYGAFEAGRAALHAGRAVRYVYDPRANVYEGRPTTQPLAAALAGTAAAGGGVVVHVAVPLAADEV